MYTLHNFNENYNCISKLNDIKRWCENSDIFTLDEYANLLHKNIGRLYSVFNDPKLIYFGEISPTRIPPPSDPLSVGKKYLSIDLRHAYSQFVDSLHIFNDKFEDILFNELPYFMRESKKARIFMYLQIPNHNISKLHIYKLFNRLFESDHKISQYLKEYNLSPVSYNTDELIYDISNFPNLFDEFIGDLTINGIDIHVNTFDQHYISFIDPFIKEEKTIPIKQSGSYTNYVTSLTCPYMNQIYKVYNNLPIIENDLYIPHREFLDKIIKLDGPIKITNKQ
jgi:hypothetical protein